MHEENPGVGAAGAGSLIAATGVNVAGMRDALPRMAQLAEALVSGRELGPPEEEGYVPRGFRRNRIAEKPGAERAIDLLLDKLAGETRSEVAGGFDRVPPPPAVADLSTALLALVTEAGCVPQGNPDRLPTIRAQGWLRYELGGERHPRFRAATSRCTAASTSRSPTRTRTGSSRSTRSALARRAGPHRRASTTSSTRPPATAPRSRPRPASGARSPAELREAGVEAVLLSGT